MDSTIGTWKDPFGAEIAINGSENFLTLKYNNGRPVFKGYELELGSPVLNVDFSDMKQPDGGLQAGVLSLDDKTITWSNSTVWTRIS